MTPDRLKEMISAKAIPPIPVDWLWLDLGFLASETPNGDQTRLLQSQLDAWAWEFVSSGGQIGWSDFRRLNEMSRGAFMRAGARLRRESAMEIAAAIGAALVPSDPPPQASTKTMDKIARIAAGLEDPDPDVPIEPTVEEFTPIGAEPNAAAVAGEPAVVGESLDSALDYVETTLRGEG